MNFEFLAHLADAASSAILPHFRTALAAENKSGVRFDPVTAADRAAEAAIRKIIADAYPDHGIIGEEFGGERMGAERVWVIDPIDGTRAFLAGLPLWGTLVGLLERGRPVLGMMAQPYIGELFLGDGRRAEVRRNGVTSGLRTRSPASLERATLMTTTPRLFSREDAAAYERVAAAVRNERFGADCYAYAMVAAGHVDLVVEANLMSYDIAGLIPIIEGAGGIVTTWQGGPATDGGRIIAAGDRALHAQALALLAT